MAPWRRCSSVLESAPAALLLASFFVASLARAAAIDPAAGPGRPAAPSSGSVALIPKAWDRSIYDLDGRVVTAVNDVTFEAPPAYQESFAFWTGRMKGGQRTELIRLLTTTRERAEDGSLPFHRQVARFQVDLLEQGQLKTPAGGLLQQVISMGWEGVLDPQGNVRDISVTHGPENPADVEQLSFDLLDRLFPRLGERRDMKPGDFFVDRISMRLPQRLAVKGLDETGVVVSRTFTLRSVRGSQAIFHLKVTYEADPATPPTAPKTACTIGGGGAGEAVFDRDDGLFVRSELESEMVIELEAPLRRLPDQPEEFDPGTAKSRIDLSLILSASQKLARLFSDPQEGPAAGAAADEKSPAPGS